MKCPVFIKQLIFAGLVLFFSVLNCQGKTILSYPRIDGMGEDGYGYQLLKLVLEKTDKDYEVVLTGDHVNQERAFRSLDKDIYHVVDNCSGQALEERATAVYIPIDRGLMGWRLFIIHRGQCQAFSRISSLPQLQTKTAGQGARWADVKILEQAGISVITAPKMDHLMRMVNAGRFDFFPLGINEVYGFLHPRNLPELMVEEHLVLVYPFARFFYVKKGNTRLHSDILKGLEAAWADQSFQRFFLNHPFTRQGLDQARLQGRTVIAIDNPLTTRAFNRIDPKWWYTPITDSL